MKRTFLLLIFLSTFAYGQGSYTLGYGGAASGSFTIGYGNSNVVNIPGYAQLPLNWADDQECNPPGGIFDVVRAVGVNYTANAAGFGLAFQDWVGASDQWFQLQVPVASFGTSNPVVIGSIVKLPGKPGATKCFVIQGTGTIAPNQTLCSHRTNDNANGSSPRNLGCTNDIAQLATIEGQWIPGNNGQLFQACSVGVDPNCSVGPNHIAVKNLELRPKAGTDWGSQFLFNLDDGDQTGLFGESHIWFLQNYIHADATESATATNKLASLLRFTGCSYCGAAFNYFDGVLSLGSESHLVTATWSPGPLKFVGNWFESSSVPLIFGGAATTLLPNENVYDVEMRRNRFTHSPLWMPLSGALAIKSSGEFKTCSRCLLDGNIFENANTSGGQKGQGFTLTPRNTSGGALGENYNNSINDITFTNNIIRHTVTGIETSSRSGSAGNGGGAAIPGYNWLFSNLLFYDISPGTSSIFNNTVTIPFIVEVGGGGNNWTASSAVRDPTGQFTTLTLVDGGAGLHKTTMGPGDLVHVQGCTDPTFNTPLHDVKFFGEGPMALQGTQSFVLVAGNPVPGPVVYPNVGTPNATSAGCLVFNDQGFQRNFTVRHITAIGNFSAASKGQVPSCLGIDTYAQKYTFQDNLIAPLPTNYSGLICQGDGLTEGTKSQANMADPATFVFNHNALVGRNAANYTDYPGTSPSTTNWFPSTPWCAPGTTDFTTCFGFNGMMNTTAYQPNAVDYHDYVLNSNSVFKAGGARQASDSTQVGANIPAIDSALTAPIYVCLTPCGIFGPNPD